MSIWRTDLIRSVFRVTQQVNSWRVNKIDKVVYRVRINSSGGVHDHTQLTNIGVNTHVQIDAHLASTANPHSVTVAQVGAIADAPIDGNQYARKDGAWDVVSGGGAVDSVNGQIGAVVLDTDDIAEGTTNLYYTDARVSDNIDVVANVTHAARTDNPHQVTLTQMNANPPNYVTVDWDHIDLVLHQLKLGTLASGQYMSFTGSALQSDGDFVVGGDLSVTGTIDQLVTHLAATNPHSVTAAQAGALSIVNDLSDVLSQQTALNNVTAVLGVTNEYVLTKDTATGDAIWKAAAGSVDSVNGKTGVVVLTTSDIAEGTNLYYTEGRVSANADVTANTTDRHTHANSVVLDAITAAGSGSIITFAERSAVTAIPTAGIAGQVLTKIDGTDYNTQWATPDVTGVFGRTGAVVAQANDYTWAQIDKTISDIANLTAKSHTSLTDIGVNTHTQIDAHLALVNEHIDWTAATANFSTTGTAIISPSTTGTADGMVLHPVHTIAGFDSGVWRGFCLAATVNRDSGSLWLGSGVAFDLDVIVVDSGDLGSIATLQLLNGSLDLGGVKNGTDKAPVQIDITNPHSSQEFPNGGLRVNVTAGAGATGTVIGLFSSATADGSATTYGYKGYATSLATATGEIVGVLGTCFPASTAAHSAAVGVEAQVLGGAGVAPDKKMAIRTSGGHSLLRGSTIIVSGSPTTPNAVPTTHLDFLNNTAEVYVENNAEFDGEVFCDGNESHSLVETTTTPYTASAVTYIMVDATAGNKVVDLPAISGLSGNREYVVKKIDSSVNTVTVDGNSGETIDGATTVVLSSQYSKLRIIAGGTEWHDVT